MPLGPEPTDEEIASLGVGEPSTSIGPEASSEPPPQHTEPHREGLAEQLTPEQLAALRAVEAEDARRSEEVEQDQTEILPAEFDPKFRDDFLGLLYIGNATHEFQWFGHTFKIRTLTTNEILEIGLLHRDYRDTLSDIKAYQAALVAACVISVDGKPLPQPITSDPADTPLSNRFRYVVDKWFPITLDAVYQEYLVLEARVLKAVEAMGKASASQG